MPPKFIPGIQLCRSFYQQEVQPLLQTHFPRLVYSAALLGDGSEVLHCDTRMSGDHHWGPRVMLFVHEKDRHLAKAIHELLAEKLPYSFHGSPTNFSKPDSNHNGVQQLQVINSGPVNHRVTVQTFRQFVKNHLGFDPIALPSAAEWLSFPQQKLLTLTAGAIYYDGIGLEDLRTPFRWYPHDLWLYLLAAGWRRIEQEEHLMGRAGLAGDELGSALIGSRLAQHVINLCFLMEKKYVPYPKWLGTAFKRLNCGKALYPMLRRILSARTWRMREKLLIPAYEFLARKHNALKLTRPMPEKTTQFFNRPFQVMAFHGFADALLEQIRDPQVKKIAELPAIGNIDQFSDSADLLSYPLWLNKVKTLYKT